VHSQSALADDPEIVIPPGGIVSIISTHNQALGTWMEGDHQIIDPGYEAGDLLEGSSGRDMIIGHHGDDTLLGGDGEDILNGGEGDDLLIGGADADLILTGPGNDTVVGEGNDFILLGNGANTVESGADHVIIAVVDGSAEINMEGSGLILAGDVADIVVNGYDPETSALHLGSFDLEGDDLSAALIADGDDLLIERGEGFGSIRLTGMAEHPDAVTASLFHQMDEDSQLEMVEPVMTQMTLMQYEGIEQEIQHMSGGLEILDLAGEIPEDEDGYGFRLESESEHDPPDDDEDPPDEDVSFPIVDEEEEDEEGMPDPVFGGMAGGCMIADGLFGGVPHPHVLALRGYRNHILRASWGGRLVILAYRLISPVVCRHIDQAGMSGRIGRAALALPAAWACKSLSRQGIAA
jgi:hypothetical protein